MDFDWRVFNTTLILTLIGLFLRQSKKIDVIYQALFGVDGRNGMLRRLDAIDKDAGTVDARITTSRHDSNAKATAAIADWYLLMNKDIDELKADIKELKVDIKELRKEK